MTSIGREREGLIEPSRDAMGDETDTGRGRPLWPTALIAGFIAAVVAWLCVEATLRA
jgi:hypothetical protein